MPDMNCKTCDKELTGRQTKFCSAACKGKDTNNKFQNYEAQQARGLRNKIHFIKLLGGKCENCGYKKNISCLCFNHKEKSDSDKKLDLRAMSNNSMETLTEEVKKCQLLCQNCFTEQENPEFNDLLND
jgi:hypothetical protein